ncbi:hypothetical protein H0H81_001798 [Sphagnurus paluster]|uniref:Uncharacterized protein n=1 Tax=Sphagnurus paluster TaxID=117069 RepID=A0A9P7K2T7_9AGAR|nr:hypothetical protein H0H81_001798 [Sphagnurus paluster]
MEKCQHVRQSLAEFAKEEDPLVKKPLKGVDAVSKVFSEIWNAVKAESLVIADALGKATAQTLPAIIKKLTEELKPVKEACDNIKTEVLNYAEAVAP